MRLLTRTLLRATQVADRTHAQLLQTLSMVGSEVTENTGTKYAAPAQLATVARSVAAEIAKIAAAFQFEDARAPRG